MRRPVFFVFIAGLLCASLTLKMVATGAAAVSLEPDDVDIQTLLHDQGFEVSRARPNTDPAWITGSQPGCSVMIANVSPQGWHMQAVEWQAAGKKLQYAFSGQIYDKQPKFRTLFSDYVSRLKRNLGIAAPPPKIRAIVMDPGCGEMIRDEALARLS